MKMNPQREGKRITEIKEEDNEKEKDDIDGLI